LRLKQVIMNLTSNAIKFTPEGSVTISCELLDDKKTFVLAVSDTGIGIDQSHLDIIFEQFGQVESYETREHQGTGLGLSITKQLVSFHGGRIDVFSTVGEGTTFQVFIPLKPNNSFSTENESSCASSMFQPVATTASLKSSRDQSKLTLDSARVRAPSDESSALVKPASEASAAAGVSTTGTDTQPRLVAPVSIPEQRSISTELIGSDYATGKETNDGHRVDSLDDVPLRVLAVDDIAINLKVLSNFLVKDRMEVTTVSNGKKLLEILSGYKWINYDVILLDWMMPVMDGITACRLIRERIQTDLLPIMFLTAKSDPADMNKGFEAGGTDYAVKPFNRHEIIARTRSLGKSARRARALYHDSIPNAPKLLTRDPFWKIHSAVKTMPMFVICVHSGSPGQNYHQSGIDGPTLLRLFRAQQLLSDSELSFCEVDERSVSFLVATTSVQQVRVLLRSALANPDWIESQVAKSASGDAHHDKPMITVGIDHRPVTAHLFADKLPMLAAVESPVAHAKLLAQTGTKHEEFLLSESAKMVLNSRHCA
jgi:CheY-like chemotaxis protein